MRGRIPNFYPRSPCGERPQLFPARRSAPEFLSTFPLRGTSQARCTGAAPAAISIHVPLAGNVACPQNAVCNSHNFYPRSPCGERPRRAAARREKRDFYPRSPCGERLAAGGHVVYNIVISIHVPLAGNVVAHHAAARDGEKFLSTFPLRGTSPAAPCPR